METELCAFAPADWQIKSIDDVCVRVTSGGTPSRREPAYYADGTWPWVKTQELQDEWIDDTEERITDEAVALSSAKVLPAHTVLIAMYGATVGQLGILRRPMTCNQACSALIVDPREADYRFLYFQLLQARSQLKNLATGAAQQNLSGVLIKSLRFPFPSVEEQRAIAHILGTLDDKIELNRRRNQTLEAMARALFKDWFVYFGPVRAKMEDRDPYLPAGLWQLFPARLDDEGKPEGWSFTQLGDVTTELRRGISPSYIESGGVRVLNQKCIRSREIYFGPARRHDQSKRKVNGRTLMDGDILVNSTGVGTLGRVAQLWNIDEPTVVDSHVSVVRPNTNIVGASYLGLNLTDRETEIELLGEGSTGQTELSRARLGSLAVLVPPRDVMDQFETRVRPIFGAIASNAAENTNLAKLRDAQLPKLISGGLRIADAEKILKKAGL